MEIKKNIETIKNENGIILYQIDGKKTIFIIDFDESSFPQNSDRKFNLINFKKASIDEGENTYNGVTIEFKKDDYIDEIYSILIKRKNDDFYKIFIELNNLFKFKSEPSFEEFRGYVGEALYLLNNGGRRTKISNDTFDIFSPSGELIEVKTYSKQKKSITVSHEQLVQGAELFIVPLIDDENGKTIIEIVDQIDDNEFKIEVKEIFEDSIYATYKFQNVKPEKISWRPKIEKELPKGITSASYNMNIEKPE